MFFDFPREYGFKFNDEYEEWQMLYNNNMLMLSENEDTWILSLLDDNDNINILIEGREEDIISYLKTI